MEDVIKKPYFKPTYVRVPVDIRSTFTFDSTVWGSDEQDIGGGGNPFDH